MAFESLKSMFSNGPPNSNKKESKESKESLFPNSGEFGSVNLSAESAESDNTIRPGSKSSNIFGDLIGSKGTSELGAKDDLFTLKQSNDSFSPNSGRLNKINMDSINDLAKTSLLQVKEPILKSQSTYYLRIFGITVLLLLLLGSVLIKSAPTNMQGVKDKVFGYINFSDWFSDPVPDLPKQKKQNKKRTKKQKDQQERNANDEENINKPAMDRHKYKPAVMPDDAMSMVQQSKPTGKSGWCFIGEDRGFRSCVNVNTNDTCMSGKIFENEEKCINPELRF